jgi:hypothetical protein
MVRRSKSHNRRSRRSRTLKQRRTLHRHKISGVTLRRQSLRRLKQGLQQRKSRKVRRRTRRLSRKQKGGFETRG